VSSQATTMQYRQPSRITQKELDEGKRKGLDADLLAEGAKNTGSFDPKEVNIHIAIHNQLYPKVKVNGQWQYPEDEMFPEMRKDNMHIKHFADRTGVTHAQWMAEVARLEGKWDRKPMSEGGTFTLTAHPTAPMRNMSRNSWSSTGSTFGGSSSYVSPSASRDASSSTSSHSRAHSASFTSTPVYVNQSTSYASVASGRSGGSGGSVSGSGSVGSGNGKCTHYVSKYGYNLVTCENCAPGSTTSVTPYTQSVNNTSSPSVYPTSSYSSYTSSSSSTGGTGTTTKYKSKYGYNFD